MENPPGLNHVDGQTRFQPVGPGQLSVLNLAATLKDAMKDFNPPAAGIPAQLFQRLFQRFHRQAAQEHPFDWFNSRWRRYLPRLHRPEAHLGHLGFAHGWGQLHLRESHFELCYSRWVCPSTRHFDLDRPIARLSLNVGPETLLSLGQQTILLRPYEQGWPIRPCLGPDEEFIDVGFAVAHADQARVGALG